MTLSAKATRKLVIKTVRESLRDHPEEWLRTDTETLSHKTKKAYIQIHTNGLISIRIEYDQYSTERYILSSFFGMSSDYREVSNSVRALLQPNVLDSLKSLNPKYYEHLSDKQKAYLVTREMVK